MTTVAPRAASPPRFLGHRIWCVGEAITYHFNRIPRGAWPPRRREGGYLSLFCAPAFKSPWRLFHVLRSSTSPLSVLNYRVSYGSPECATESPPKFLEAAATHRVFPPEICGCPCPTIRPHDFMCRWRFGTAVQVAYEVRLGRATRRRNQRGKLGIHQIQ